MTRPLLRLLSLHGQPRVAPRRVYPGDPWAQVPGYWGLEDLRATLVITWGEGVPCPTAYPAGYRPLRHGEQSAPGDYYWNALIEEWQDIFIGHPTFAPALCCRRREG